MTTNLVQYDVNNTFFPNLQTIKNCISVGFESNDYLLQTLDNTIKMGYEIYSKEQINNIKFDILKLLESECNNEGQKCENNGEYFTTGDVSNCVLLIIETLGLTEQTYCTCDKKTKGRKIHIRMENDEDLIGNCSICKKQVK